MLDVNLNFKTSKNMFFCELIEFLGGYLTL